MKNNRKKLLEVETMNEVGLQDLLDLSSKVLTSIVQLQNSALKFNNKRIMMLATKMNSTSGEFHDYVSQLVMAGPSSDSDITADGSEAPDKIPLDNPKKNPVIESVKEKYLKRKKLKEAEEAEEQEDEDDDSKDYTSDYNSEEEHDLVIDLTEPFQKIINGLDDNEFDSFKSDVVSKLENNIDIIEDKKGAEAADEYAKTVEAMDAANEPKDFDYALNQLYDFADEKEIVVETVKRKNKNRI